MANLKSPPRRIAAKSPLRETTVVAIPQTPQSKAIYDRLQHPPRITDLWSGLLDTGPQRKRAEILALLAFQSSSPEKRPRVKAGATKSKPSTNSKHHLRHRLTPPPPPSRTTTAKLHPGVGAPLRFQPQARVSFRFSAIAGLRLRRVSAPRLCVASSAPVWLSRPLRTRTRPSMSFCRWRLRSREILPPQSHPLTLHQTTTRKRRGSTRWPKSLVGS